MPARKMGTWKLAYADFLTALVAFFLLLWLVSGVSKDDRAVIAAEFTAKRVTVSASTILAASEADQLVEKLKFSPDIAAATDSVLLFAEEGGVRIELVDTASRPLFETGSGALTRDGERLVEAAASALSGLPYGVSIEGHTDAFSMSEAGFSNWELSSQRANEARRVLESDTFGSNRVRSVTGYADTRPLSAGQPHLAANRRISLRVHIPG